MTHTSLLGRCACALPVLSILYLSAPLTAGQNPFRKNPNYEIFRDPGGRFELEYPSRDWRLLPSGGSSLAVFNHNDGPALFIDHFKMAERLTPAEVDAMAENEVDRLKDQQPTGKNFKSAMLDTKAGRGVLIRYSRAGTVPEAVMQYSIPVGLDLYRLNGVVPEKQLSKYQPVIMRMIQSFKAPADPSPRK